MHERPNELYLALIELRSAWRNRGFGTGILRWLMARAKKSGRPLSLHVLRANPRAAALYEREGFVIVETEPLKLLMRSGQALS